MVDDFRASAVRALDAGFEVAELHAAHGYLLHQFLSPLSNQRDDAYGGSLENRMRLVLQVFDAVKAAVPASMAVGVRISATDWVEGGWDLAQSLALAKALEARGSHFIHVSSGGLHPAQKIELAPGYQVPFAEAIKREVGMPVIAVGLITTPQQAEGILQQAQADAIGIARGFDRGEWFASLGRGFETPTVTELSYRPDGGGGLNLGLRPSDARSLETGLRWRTDGLRVHARYALPHPCPAYQST